MPVFSYRVRVLKVLIRYSRTGENPRQKAMVTECLSMEEFTSYPGTVTALLGATAVSGGRYR